MSARNIWCPSESVVRDLPAPQATQPTGGISSGADVRKPLTEPAYLATPVKAKPKIVRRRTPTVDTNVTRVATTGGNYCEKQQAEEGGRGIVPSTYATIENSGTCRDMKCIVSSLLQCRGCSQSLEGDFHGWLQNDPTLHWNSIFMSKSEYSSGKTVKESTRTRRQQSEEYIFYHYENISDYMRYYRKHCMLTSLSNTSLRHSRWRNKQERPKLEETTKQEDKGPTTRPQTQAQGVYRTIDKDEQYQRTTSDRPVNGLYQQQIFSSTHTLRLAELENRLNLRASVLSPSKPFTLVPKPTPPSIVNKESSSIILCGTGSNEKLVTLLQHNGCLSLTVFTCLCRSKEDDVVLHNQSKVGCYVTVL